MFSVQPGPPSSQLLNRGDVMARHVPEWSRDGEDGEVVKENRGEAGVASASNANVQPDALRCMLIESLSAVTAARAEDSSSCVDARLQRITARSFSHPVVDVQ